MKHTPREIRIFNRLTPTQKKIHALLLANTGPFGSVVMAQSQIVAQIGCTYETLRTAIKRFEELNMLSKGIEWSGVPIRKRYSYILHLTPFDGEI